MSKKVYIQSLGCPKNLVDSEVMLGGLIANNYEVTRDPEEADLLLINTCGFIQPAVEEGIDEILQLAEIKKSGFGKRLVVTGCLVQRYGSDLQKQLPEVDLFIGTQGFHHIVQELAKLDGGIKNEFKISNPTFIMDSAVPRVISTPAHRAYLKITEGCNNRCSYCLIPSLRGNLRSRKIDDLVQEAIMLASAGVKELSLIAQDLTAYGTDLGNKAPQLDDLLEALLSSSDIPWFRMLYLYPARINDRLLDLVAENPRILPYFDIPLQHISEGIIKKMNRPYGRREVDKLIEKIRVRLPESAIRTTFMVGFPGENDKDITELESFIRQQRFAHVGIFTYSNEDGCEAQKLPDQCSEQIKEERRERLMKVQSEISMELNQKYVGRTEKVLVEGLSSESDLLLEGRTIYQAPDIDGCVYITSGECTTGDILDVKITEAHHYDLVGELVESR
ncbi:MAG: 30S ribosomal protein S12 methylthiotransferase RimO [Proteobacteria bacterium]|nr:30S ribosomal protein S12 methylthiotransferase RimO [Pseudomonadota bacterium]MBU1714173.1 30S ribosomal protein S12 methylthiotransferase RimO [Pseudomonadota bacterium]